MSHPPPEKHDVVIIQATPELPPNFRESLHSSGFASYVISEAKEAYESLRKLSQPILCVYTGTDFSALTRLTSVLLSDARIHQYPLLLVSSDDGSHEKSLGKVFRFVMNQGQPHKARDIIEALTYIRDSYNEFGVKEPRASHADQTLSTDERRFRDFKPHEAYTHIVQIPSLVLTELSSMKLLSMTLAGGEYVSAGKTGQIQDKSYLPTDPRVVEKVTEVCRTVGSEGAMHLHRVSFLVHRISQALSTKDHLLDDVKAASFLYAWALKSNETQMLKQDFLGERAFSLRKRFSETVAQSGAKIGTNLQKPVAATIVSTMAKLISREKSVSDDEIAVISSIVMAADMIDRTCYYLGRWNPRGAYTFMHNARSGQIRDIHPKVLACMIKVVSEAASSFAPAILVRKKFRDDPLLQEEAQRTKELLPEGEEEKLPLSALTPGMKISRPIKAFDGRLVLDKDMVLDHDLIWRIWQLSAVRPLNQPLMVIAPQSSAQSE